MKEDEYNRCECEDEVEVAFASESVCHGLELLHLTPETVHTAVKNPAAPATGKMLPAANPHWSLILDLDGHTHNQAGQGWSLVDSSAKAFEWNDNDAQGFGAACLQNRKRRGRRHQVEAACELQFAWW
jgi:hypothetical protein